MPRAITQKMIAQQMWICIADAPLCRWLETTPHPRNLRRYGSRQKNTRHWHATALVPRVNSANDLLPYRSSIIFFADLWSPALIR